MKDYCVDWSNSEGLIYQATIAESKTVDLQGVLENSIALGNTWPDKEAVLERIRIELLIRELGLGT